MWRPGMAEIIIVLVIVVLLFGPGRISKISKEIGSSIKAFRDGLKEDSPEEQKKDSKDSSHQDPPADAS